MDAVHRQAQDCSEYMTKDPGIKHCVYWWGLEESFSIPAYTDYVPAPCANANSIFCQSPVTGPLNPPMLSLTRAQTGQKVPLLLGLTSNRRLLLT